MCRPFFYKNGTGEFAAAMILCRSGYRYPVKAGGARAKERRCWNVSDFAIDDSYIDHRDFDPDFNSVYAESYSEGDQGDQAQCAVQPPGKRKGQQI